MKPTHIIYTSNTGHTERYAKILEEKTGIPALSMEQATDTVTPGSPILYLGWLFVGGIRGYKKAAKRYSVCAVCGVGLCDTGALLSEIRRTEKIPGSIPLFTLQGGMDHEKLTGIYKKMIDTLILFVRKKKNKSEDDARMLYLLESGGDYVSEAHLTDVLHWYESADDLA